MAFPILFGFKRKLALCQRACSDSCVERQLVGTGVSVMPYGIFRVIRQSLPCTSLGADDLRQECESVRKPNHLASVRVDHHKPQNGLGAFAGQPARGPVPASRRQDLATGHSETWLRMISGAREPELRPVSPHNWGQPAAVAHPLWVGLEKLFRNWKSLPRGPMG